MEFEEFQGSPCDSDEENSDGANDDSDDAIDNDDTKATSENEHMEESGASDVKMKRVSLGSSTDVPDENQNDEEASSQASDVDSEATLMLPGLGSSDEEAKEDRDTSRPLTQ